ncbi:hypothetical protein BDF14DRAFT_9805 [Spinellus fusiger]|nr:hypothetical protein BDF14DRAFT_9805 [Spinellus fusiger]
MSAKPSTVPVDLYVMSKCPDKVYCEQHIAKVLASTSVPVTLNVNYIAKADPNDVFNTECKHGATECLGNKQELCFKSLYPERKDWFAYDLCVNKNYQDIGKDTLLLEHCAGLQGKNATLVQECATSEKGARMLSESAQETASLGVTSSCTIFINNELRCIHDRTWKSCSKGYKVDDFVKTIEDVYTDLVSGSEDEE